MEQVAQKENSKVKKGKKKNKGKNKLDGDSSSSAEKANDASSSEQSKKNVNRPNKEIVDLFWLVSNEDAKVNIKVK